MRKWFARVLLHPLRGSPLPEGAFGSLRSHGRSKPLPYDGEWSLCAEGECVRKWSELPPLTHYVGAPLEGEPFGTPRRRPLQGEMEFVRRRKLPRQAPSVPIRRAGRRARDEDWVMLYELGGEKSSIGGICNSFGAPHLNRRFLREVRSPFFFVGNWSGRAVNLQGCLLLL